MVRSHCGSDQLDRPDRPNCPTKLDQLLGRACTRLVSDRYSTMHDLHTTSHDFNPFSTRSSQPLHEPYTMSTRPTRSTRPLLDLTRSLLYLRVGYKNLRSFLWHSVDLRSTRVMEVEQLQCGPGGYSSRETGSWLRWSLKRKKRGYCRRRGLSTSRTGLSAFSRHPSSIVYTIAIHTVYSGCS